MMFCKMLCECSRHFTFPCITEIALEKLTFTTEEGNVIWLECFYPQYVMDITIQPSVLDSDAQWLLIKGKPALNNVDVPEMSIWAGINWEFKGLIRGWMRRGFVHCCVVLPLCLWLGPLCVIARLLNAHLGGWDLFIFIHCSGERWLVPCCFV